MAMRWVRTIDEAPHVFATGDDENSDWVLYSGGWLVGRVHRPGSGRQDIFSWSLTGPHTPFVSARGDGATINDAKERLIAALRTWAAWAGVRREGADAPRWIPTKDYQMRSFGSAYEEETDWVLVSGGLMVGRVHRPLMGPRHDPHWALTGLRSPRAPLEQQAWADSIDDGKAKLFGAWCAWLRWAELPVPAAPEHSAAS
jgi:hypothetical protein